MSKNRLFDAKFVGLFDRHCQSGIDISSLEEYDANFDYSTRRVVTAE